MLAWGLYKRLAARRTYHLSIPRGGFHKGSKMGVGEEFAAFKDQYNIPSGKISSISYRYKRITRQLNIDFWNTTSDTAHSLYVGSYGRDTAARGVSDLDIGFILPSTLYMQYSSYSTNGQSALLQAVRRSIQK